MAESNRGRGSGPEHRAALLSLLEVHTEGATATELGSYVGRHRVSVREQLLVLQEQGKVTESSDYLWHLAEPEAAHRATLTPATPVQHVLSPPRSRIR